MATFKVGDRARVLPGAGGLSGVEVTIRSCHGDFCGVTPDHPVRGSFDWYAMNAVLVPLTPPAADTWAADKVKQVTKPQYVEVPV